MINRRQLLLCSTAAAITHYCALAAAAESSRPKHPYDNWKAIQYARAHCAATNSCGVLLSGENLSDCAHFIAHCLDAGGITIRSSESVAHLCPNQLAVRNVEIVEHLRKLAKDYENIKEMDLSDAIIGDVGFLMNYYPRRGGIVPSHAFMISKPGKYMGDLSRPYVYAHSISRCGTDTDQLDTEWRQLFSTSFRLEDGGGIRPNSPILRSVQ